MSITLCMAPTNNHRAPEHTAELNYETAKPGTRMTETVAVSLFIAVSHMLPETCRYDMSIRRLGIRQRRPNGTHFGGFAKV